jgi:GT2 family glycosyltransferase
MLPNKVNRLFAIGIPTINRADLLNPVLEQYVKDFPGTQIYIQDNGHQELFQHRNIRVARNTDSDGKVTNLGVAGSWNNLCRFIFHSADSKPFAWILNDDIYSGRKEKDITDFLQCLNSRVCFVSAGNWSNFLIKKELFQKVGEFDEKFYPAYYEDNDYRYRIKLLKDDWAYLSHNMLKPDVLRISSSIQKDPTLNAGFQTNLNRYKAKWGGLPEEETYRIPFDGALEK